VKKGVDKTTVGYTLLLFWGGGNTDGDRQPKSGRQTARDR
jgi:hypothetical protein